MKNIIFEPVTGDVVLYLRSKLPSAGKTYTTNVLVRSILPEENQRQKRMVIVRDDGGRDEGPLSRRGFSINVWSENKGNADLLAQYIMAVLRSMPNGDPIVWTENFFGPFEVIDENKGKIVVDGATLSHYFFNFEAMQRAKNL
jgi:hypothetical protein